MKISTEGFYSDLTLRKQDLSDLIADASMFSKLPSDWHVLVADIKNSTQAIQDGFHQEVNLIATGSVIAILNISAEAGINVPFFFGGDGAVILVPSILLKEGISALNKHKINTFRTFGFELKIGSVSVEDIYRKNIELKIAKARISDIFNIPVVLGDGLQFAESLVKEGDDSEIKKLPIDEIPLNLDGMECKWNRINPPEDDQEVISLIVSGNSKSDIGQTFSEVLKAIDSIYGSPNRRKPISVKRLQLNSSWRQINLEMQTKLGHYNNLYFLKNWFKTIFGRFYLTQTQIGKNYLEKLVQLTDTLTIDGRINTVITGTSQQRKNLIAFLDHLENRGRINYGLYVSKASVMSCYVKDMGADDHIHFVDGADGGYTKAAVNLKKKISQDLRPL